MPPPVPRSSSRFRTLLRVAVVIFVAVFAWSAYVVRQINEVAGEDQAAPADAIAVFGAAEYGGRPSPVLHARLDHAVDLYEHGIAPMLITLGGGADRDSGKTEGGVGRDYLLARGVPMADIIAETRSVDTEEQVQRLAAIARDHGFARIVVVSDATHMFRIRELCQQAGLDVYTSPRAPVGRISSGEVVARYTHEILSYTLLRLGAYGSWGHRLSGGRVDE